MTNFDIAILQYNSSMQSAALGLIDTFTMANQTLETENYELRFNAYQVSETQLARVETGAIIIPPGHDSDTYKNPSPVLCNDLRELHRNGVTLCSICGGAFILAKAGLLEHREVTTHWKLANELQESYPTINVAAQRILINDIDIITAGGVMAWLDLALEIVRLKTDAHIMRELGRHIIVDPGTREQSYYQSFSPNTLHGDNQVLKAQQEIQQHYGDQIVIADLARACFLSERTFLRRFAKATGYKPKEYLQRLRIQKACELFETSDISVEDAATQVGYRDISAFRKTFVKNMGLTPSEFTHRFAGEHNMRQAV